MSSTGTRQVLLIGAIIANAVPAMGYLLRNMQTSCNHLSPLLQYEPPDAWTHTLNMSYSDEPGASISFRHWGVQWAFRGDPPMAGMITTAEPAYEEMPNPSWDLIIESNWTDVNGTAQYEARYPGPVSYSSTLRWREVRFAAAENFTSNATDEQRRFAVSGLSWVYPMPIDEAFADSTSSHGSPSPQWLDIRGRVDLEPTVWANNETNTNFYFLTEGWYVAQLNESLRDRISVNAILGRLNWRFRDERDDINSQFINNTILAIDSNTTGASSARMQFRVRALTSYLRLYGSVGPNMASMTVEVESQDSTDNIPIRNLSGTQVGNSLSYQYEIDCRRPVEATGIDLLAIPIDARTNYNIIITPIWPQYQDEPTRLELNGAWFGTFADPDDAFPANDWVADRNQELGYRLGWESRPRSGLSTGQIVGVVLGSVFGALIIGGLVWGCCRHERRKQDAEKARMASKTADDQRTITDASPITSANDEV